MTIKVCIKETLERVVEIPFEEGMVTEADYINKAWDLYNDGYIVLGSEDYTDTEITIYED